MKLHATLMVSLLALAGLSAQAAKAPAPLKVVQGYMAAWSENAGKTAVSESEVMDAVNHAAGFFDFEVEYLDSTVGTPQYGAIVARDNVIKAFLVSFPNAKWEMTGPAKVKGNMVEYDWKFSGNALGPYIMDASCKGAGEAIAFSGHSKIVVSKQGLIKYQNDSYSADDFSAQIAPSDSACKAQKAAEAAAKPAQ